MKKLDDIDKRILQPLSPEILRHVGDINWLIVRIRKLETALRFYGAEHNWRHNQFVDISNVIDEDGGHTAREALKED